jgi:hypothetical protein
MPQEWDSPLALTPGIHLRLTSSTSCTHQSTGLTDTSTVPSPGDGTGDLPFPFPTYEAAASQFVSANRIDSRGFAYHVLQVPSSAASLPNFDFADVFQPEHAPGTLPSWLIGDGVDASTSDLFGMYEDP